MILLMSRECSENWPINVQNNPLFALNPFKPMAIVHVFLNLNAPWSIDNPQRCPWNFNDFSLTLFIVITCTQNVLFQHVQGLYPYLTTVLQIETLFAGPAKCGWVVWQRGAIGRPWCRMARLFQLRGLCVPPLWRDVRFTPQVRHVPRKLWWYNPC